MCNVYKSQPAPTYIYPFLPLCYCRHTYIQYIYIPLRLPLFSPTNLSSFTLHRLPISFSPHTSTHTTHTHPLLSFTTNANPLPYSFPFCLTIHAISLPPPRSFQSRMPNLLPPPFETHNTPSLFTHNPHLHPSIHRGTLPPFS
jgi:hypothetical protein